MFNNTSVSTEKLSQGNINTVIIEAVVELVPIALLITIANGLVLVLFTKNTMLRTAPNYVLFSLAVCDFMTGIINIPLFITVEFTPVIKSFEVRYYMAILVSVLNNLTAISSCYHILVATTEKYLSIIRPVKHRLITRRTVAKVVKVVWVVSVIVAFSPFAWVIMEDRETQTRLALAHVIFCLVAVFLLPYAFMIYAFIVIFKSISNKGKAKRGATSERPFLSRQAALEKRCLILFVAMATIFLLCWLPWFILMMLFKVKKDVNSLEIPAHVSVLVRYATSIINPVLYTFFRRDFKTALQSLF
ncbi:alpha-2C adrenergic receptor-like [Stylophora pistillata]|uniref:alpha-2C adrenergic receptor-like n=1 Tax=Stylophora pistillata TaxID=50429 RepID=UPI000C045588|nr:alpha-2C adrenergic receptor-like [Stylophora pistillata]XP_022801191.1 alpha-2C adrenergic receptor-like [Stylophora pistillata]